MTACLLLTWFWAAPARAETTICTPITAIPTTISTPGVYCLTGNLASNQTSGSAVTINVDDVTLDLNGHKLDGSSVGDGTHAFGIRSGGSGLRKNITVKNGTVRGFERGIYLTGSGSTTSIDTGHVVEDIRADGNISRGISVVGNGSIVRRNQVLDTGGVTTSNSSGIGIYAGGNSVQVLDNLVVNTQANRTTDTYAGIGAGINVVFGSNGVVRGNRVSNPSLPDSGSSYGVYVHGFDSFPSHHVTVSDNIVTRMTYGISYQGYTTGLYADNLVMGCTQPFLGYGTGTIDNNFWLQ